MPTGGGGDTIAVFHFHAHFELCRARIALLRRLNPGLAIHAIYGGDPAHADEARTLEAVGVEHVHTDPGVTPAWNKKNTDLAVRGWYRNIGRDVPFVRAHVIQWDLLFFDALDRVYPPLADNAVALTGLVPLSQIASFWDWVAFEPLASESARLLANARGQFGYSDEPYACIGPGYSLPRTFLARFSDVNPDDTGHDELRLPLFAQILGFPLVDTGFYPRWMDPDIEPLFNADAHEVDPARVESELRRPDGRRVFHPCRDQYTASMLERLLAHRRAS